MAWIAAIISAVGGIAASSNQKNAAKKAGKNASNIDAAGYGRALSQLKDYQGIGKEGALSLAQLMGLKGYRTSEEQELTEYLKSKPSFQASGNRVRAGDSGGLEGLLEKQEGISTLGDAFGGVSKWFKKKKDRRGAQQASNNAKEQADFQATLSAWEDKKSAIEARSNASIAGYDPTAILRATPGYQNRYDTGINAVTNQQSGRQLSGRAAQELTRYGQGFASNEFQNEFNRRLALATGGQSAATTAGNWSIGQGSNAANLAIQSGNADSQYNNDLNNVVQQGLGNYLTYKNRNQRPRTPYSSSYNNDYPRGNPDVAETYM